MKQGDTVVRDFSSRKGVIQGATYKVKDVSEQGSFIRVEGSDEWYEAWKFHILGPYDN